MKNISNFNVIFSHINHFQKLTLRSVGFDFDILYRKNSIPWYTYNYANEFIKANNAEKSALFVINQIKKIKDKKKIIKPYINKKILIIKFENLITKTRKELLRIGKFLNTPLTLSANKFMKAANCPRKIDPNLRLKNIVILKKK